MDYLTLLIKPASSACNLKCTYCFYLDVAEHRDVRSHGIMSESTLDLLVKKALAEAKKGVTFIFQGGEPTLAGLPFYESLVRFQAQYNHRNLSIINSIQTNGTLLDEDWARFFAAHHFLVGVSLDGNREIHDLNRVDHQGEGSHQTIDRNIALLKRHGVEFNILCVVTRNVARHTTKVYNHFKSKGYDYLQFIPCIEGLDSPKTLSPFALPPDAYGRFLVDLFNLWYRDIQSGRFVSIRMFDNVMHMMRGFPPESCDMQGQCSTNLVIESDGSVYPCDFYVLDEWKLGMVAESSFQDFLRQNPTGIRFVQASLPNTTSCSGCPYLGVCRGGCRRYHEMSAQQGKEGHYYCASFKKFYAHALPKLEALLRNPPKFAEMP